MAGKKDHHKEWKGFMSDALTSKKKESQLKCTY